MEIEDLMNEAEPIDEDNRRSIENMLNENAQEDY